MQLKFLEIWRAERIFPAGGIYRIKAHRREYIPCRRLPVVLVAAVSIRIGGIQPIHHFAYPILRFPRLPGVVVEVNHVLNGLVAMGIISHIHYLHLAYLVDDDAIVARVEHRR